VNVTEQYQFKIQTGLQFSITQMVEGT